MGAVQYLKHSLDASHLKTISKQHINYVWAVLRLLCTFLLLPEFSWNCSSWNAVTQKVYSSKPCLCSVEMGAASPCMPSHSRSAMTTLARLQSCLRKKQSKLIQTWMCIRIIPELEQPGLWAQEPLRQTDPSKGHNQLWKTLNPPGESPGSCHGRIYHKASTLAERKRFPHGALQQCVIYPSFALPKCP